MKEKWFITLACVVDGRFFKIFFFEGPFTDISLSILYLNTRATTCDMIMLASHHDDRGGGTGDVVEFFDFSLFFFFLIFFSPQSNYRTRPCGLDVGRSPRAVDYCLLSAMSSR